MHIIFNKIKIKNFLSIGNVFTTIRLDKHKQTLIIGKNASGKSSLLDALCFVLFNKPYRNINKPQLINSINNKDMLVELYFQINEDKYIIRRGMKPNIFEIIKNDKLLNQDADARDYQSYLEEFIIKLTYKSFCQKEIMGTASFTPFMKLSKNDRRLFIEDLLDLQIFSNMNIVLKTKLETYKNLINDIEKDINLINEKINIQERFITQLTINNEDKINKINNEISINLQLIQNKKNEIVKYKEKYDKISSNISGIDILKLEKEKKKLDKHENNLLNEKNRLNKDIIFYNNNDVCPTCKSHLSVIFKNETIRSHIDSITEIDKGISVIQVDIEKKEKCFNKYHENERILRDLLHEINMCNNEISLLEKGIKKLENERDNSDNSIIDINEEKTQLQSYRNTLENLLSRKYEYIEEKEEYDILSVLLKDNGIKSQIIKTYIPVINKTVNDYLQNMGFFCNFTLDETFNETIRSRYRDIFTYESFSEGEKKRLDIALIFTWRRIAQLRNSTTTNLIFFDEIMDSSLDYDGLDAFFKSLENKNENMNSFIISHGTVAIDRFQNIIKVEKQKNFSRWSFKE